MTSIKKNFISIAIILFLGICAYVYYLNEKKTINNNSPESTILENTVSEFQKEGTLVFYKNKLNQKLLHIEIAENEYDKQKGLMFRKTMADSLGMLFLFDVEEPQSFWMKNTHISLDIIYVNKKNIVVSIAKYTKPYSEIGIPSIKAADKVIEVNAGYCDKNQISEGDSISYSR